MEAEIRFIKKSELQKLLTFNAREYGPSHILTNKKYLDWQFGTFPKKENHYTILGLFNKKQELLGIFGLTPLPYNFFGKQVLANSCCNLMVKKECQGMGLGYLLLEKATSFNDIAVDHGINEKAWTLFGNTGWQQTNLKRYIFVLNVSKTEKLIAQPGTNVQLSQIKKPTNLKGNVKFLPIKKAGCSLDRFWEKVKNRYPSTVERTSQYLNWRYFNHNLLNYRCFIVKEGKEIMAFAALRVERPEDYKIARLLDFVADDTAEEFTLSKIIGWCKKQRVDLIDYFFSGNFHLKSLKSRGFQNSEQKPYTGLPMLLHPIEKEGDKKINFAFKLINKNLSQNLADDFNKWYTTKGGGDQDRPN